MIDSCRVHALLVEDPQLRQSDVDSTAWVVTASPVRRAARAAARWTRSSTADSHGLSVPISPMIPGRIPVPPTPPSISRDELVREVVDGPPVDPRLGRVVRGPVPAAAHHDVHATGSGELCQPDRIAPDTRQRHVDEAAPAGLPEPRELGEDHRRVAGQLPVIPATLDVPECDLGVLVGQGEAERRRLDGAEDGLDIRHRGDATPAEGPAGAIPCIVPWSVHAPEYP